ncbi:hypothetical protein BKE38_10820 [Pseudoroseomonas deserti]|uniref:PH domain-containing protein n=1 Tax=Teichococcus deserti TaxID=1817963 RepID=A0A1V2H5A8_9PROT|nr:hypothetical protein BKE38_10820 [Pseudoroseomonas deserti]
MRITVHPARPALSFLAAAWLLGLLFGLPALAVLIDPARHEPVGLAAALAGLAVVAVAAFALRRARQGRGPRPLLLDASGLTLPERHLPWSELRSLTLRQPEPGRQAAAAPGLHALAARIAARQHAAETALLAETAGEGTPLLVAGGLGPEVAAALRDAVLAARPDQ